MEFQNKCNPELSVQGNNRQKTFFDDNNDENDLSSQDNFSLCSEEKLRLSSWGLPEKVLEFYKSKGITHMFQWQLECLTRGRVLDAGNLVYSAPTSAGKTLVAEILISKTLFEIQKKALMILPFVSVVREKMFYFQSMFASSGIHVEGYMGGHSPSISFKQVHIAVCTIEKANAIINRLLEESNLQNLGLVVVDELHLLGDPYRGYLLELLLTKLKYISFKSEFKIQIIGMSATLPNLKSLADWLQANLYYTDFRPVPLKEKLKCGTVFFDKHLHKVSELTVMPSEAPDDSENICQLCVETIANGHSVLIFCPTKVWCENLADKISLFFRINGCSKSAETEGTHGWVLRRQLNLKKISEVIEHLKMCPAGLDKDLHKTIAYGVAFHHAGLTLDERDIIEGSFRQGSIRVLCATSTLSSGVNLPARRVIIRSPMSFGGLMDILTYRQMIGRAGRMGVDSEGESILISKPGEKTMCQTLMCSTLKPIESCLGHGRLSASLKRALLEIIASGIASSPEEVKEYASCTFLAFSSRYDIEDPIKSCIEFLEENEFIRLQENGTVYAPTPLGKACLASSLPPDEGLALFRELQRARRCFVLDTDLHIIYQVTPYSVSEQWNKVDWLNVLTILEALPPSMKRVGEMVGVEEGFLVRVAKGMVNTNDPENRSKLSIHRRFYTSLALQDLISEVPLSEVAEKFDCNKGMLQSLQQSAATYAGMVTEFTKCLGWSSVELIFSQFQERLQFGIQRELCDLMRLPMLNAMRARVLFSAGFTDIASIATANITDLENAFFAMVPFQSKKEIAGETSYDKDKRNKLEAIWITGKADLSIHEAAELLLTEARNILEIEIDFERAKWSKKDSSLSDSIQNRSVTHKICNTSIVQKNRNSSAAKNDSINKSNVMASQDKTENENLKKKGNSIIKANNVLVPYEFSDKKFINECNKECQEKEETLNSSQNLCNSKMKIVNEFDKEKLIASMNTSLEMPKAKVTSVEINEKKQVRASPNFSASKPEEFNFTSSFIFDMIPDYITEGRDDETVQNCSAGNIDNPSLISIKHRYSDPDSIDSVEVLYDTNIDENSKILSFSKLSEDMFDKENSSGKKMSTPIPVQNYARSAECKMSKNCLAEISSPDLFSQSLTFDTQLGRILDFEEPPPKEFQPIVNPSTSFNSDDLGFVSDLSPPKSNRKQMQNLKNPKILEDKKIKENFEMQNKSFSSLYPKKVADNLIEKEEEMSEAIKRKIDSPDLIVDSDESSMENQPAKKRVKCSFSVSKNLRSEFIAPLVVNDSDDEVMPTPKPEEVRMLNVSSRNLNRTLRSFDRSFTKRGSQRQKLTLQNSSRSKTNGRTRKYRNPISTTQVNRVKVSLAKSCRSDKLNLEKINIIDVCDKEEEFRCFCEKLNEQSIVGLALGCKRKIEDKKNLIGSRIVRKRKSENLKVDSQNCHYKEIILDGVAFYWKGNDVSYMSLDDRIIPLGDKIHFLKGLCHKKNTFRIFDVKEQIKMLKRCCSVLLRGSYQDPKVGFWLLSESWKEKNFSAMAIDYLPGSKKLVSQIGSIVGFSGPGLLAKSTISHKTRACLEAYLTYLMVEHQLPLLHAKGLEQAFVQTEMPIMICLAEMELSGIQICRKRILNIKENLDTAQKALEEKAYSLAGHKFSISSPAAIRKVLFKELNLKAETVALTKKNKQISTSKQMLQELADETKHPLPQIILEWRKIRNVLSKFVSFLLQTSAESTRVYGISQSYTVTGRISMHEPNLQNVPKIFNVENENEELISINLREVFVASENCTLISADYCQIELRILAHLSGDTKLIKSICESDDIFVNVAATVFGIPQYEVDETLRQRAKQICYGIIYGIGSQTLSEQIEMDESEAVILIENFKNQYTEVKKYIDKTINDCKKRGYVFTLLGRRRYLPAINDSNQVVRMEAERQAINTTIQGSAADLIKTAMITWREKMHNLILNGITINSVLHLHDELIFEVQKDASDAVATILKETMEGAMELTVPTPVKIKIGPSWGQLKNLDL